MRIVEKLVEWRLAEETEVPGENLPQRHLSTTYPTWLEPCSNLDRRGGKPATNHLSYGVASTNNLQNVAGVATENIFLRMWLRSNPKDKIFHYEY
jgi:hypothetical protein